MADDVGGILSFVFGEDVLGAGESDLVDVFVHFFGAHADTVVDNADSFIILVDLDFDGQVAEFAVGFAQRGQRLDLLRGIYRIGNQFSKENFVVGV